MNDKQLTRIYIVKQRKTIPGVPDAPNRLVRATSQAAAMRHVWEPTISAAVATPDELVTATLAGTKVEDAAS